jgi:hypothetical protein
MWAPLRTALLSGLGAGFASVLPQWERGAHLVLTSVVLIAAMVSIVIWLALLASRRPHLPLIPAFCVAAAAAVIALISSLPIETHAELIASPAALIGGKVSVPSAYLISLTAFALPAMVAFVVGRVRGVPPNKSLERTREG